MKTKKRRLCTVDEIRFDPKFQKPCTDDIGEFRGDCHFPPLSLLVISFLALILIAAGIAVIAQ